MRSLLAFWALLYGAAALADGYELRFTDGGWKQLENALSGEGSVPTSDALKALHRFWKKDTSKDRAAAQNQEKTHALVQKMATSADFGPKLLAALEFDHGHEARAELDGILKEAGPDAFKNLMKLARENIHTQAGIEAATVTLRAQLDRGEYEAAAEAARWVAKSARFEKNEDANLLLLLWLGHALSGDCASAIPFRERLGRMRSATFTGGQGRQCLVAPVLEHLRQCEYSGRIGLPAFIRDRPTQVTGSWLSYSDRMVDDEKILVEKSFHMPARKHVPHAEGVVIGHASLPGGHDWIVLREGEADSETTWKWIDPRGRSKSVVTNEGARFGYTSVLADGRIVFRGREAIHVVSPLQSPWSWDHAKMPLDRSGITHFARALSLPGGKLAVAIESLDTSAESGRAGGKYLLTGDSIDQVQIITPHKGMTGEIKFVPGFPAYHLTGLSDGRVLVEAKGSALVLDGADIWELATDFNGSNRIRALSNGQYVISTLEGLRWVTAKRKGGYGFGGGGKQIAVYPFAKEPDLVSVVGDRAVIVPEALTPDSKVLFLKDGKVIEEMAAPNGLLVNMSPSMLAVVSELPGERLRVRIITDKGQQDEFVVRGNTSERIEIQATGAHDYTVIASPWTTPQERTEPEKPQTVQVQWVRTTETTDPRKLLDLPCVPSEAPAAAGRPKSRSRSHAP